MDDLAFEIETDALAQVLDTLDYFQVLKIPQNATPADIKAAFYRESRAYHPDRYHAMAACPLKDNAARIYKRVTEAYVTLRDDRKRAKYREDVNGPDRDKRLRFDEEAEKEAVAAKKAAVLDQFGKTPKGRQLYQAAMKDLQGGNAEAAVRNLKLALGFEPANEMFKEQLKLAEKQIKRDFRIK